MRLDYCDGTPDCADAIDEPPGCNPAFAFGKFAMLLINEKITKINESVMTASSFIKISRE